MTTHKTADSRIAHLISYRIYTRIPCQLSPWPSKHVSYLYIFVATRPPTNKSLSHMKGKHAFCSYFLCAFTRSTDMALWPRCCKLTPQQARIQTGRMWLVWMDRKRWPRREETEKNNITEMARIHNNSQFAAVACYSFCDVYLLPRRLLLLGVFFFQFCCIYCAFNWS